MIIKWLQSMMGRQTSALDASPIEEEEEITIKERAFFDVAHEVLSREGVERQHSLKGLERYGVPYLERRKLKEQVRRKVKKHLNASMGSSEEEGVVDEVTEKITEAAEADPYYNQMFGGNEGNGQER